MIGVVLVAHRKIASEMKASVEYILHEQALFQAVDVLDSDAILDDEHAFQSILEDMAESCDGILVMVDIFGATPCNMAMNIIASFNADVAVELVAGFNLPSVLKAMMEREHVPLGELADLSLDAGQKYMRLGSSQVGSSKKAAVSVLAQDKAA